jgi:predicted esterase
METGMEAFVHHFERAPDSSSRLTLLMLHGTGGDEHDLLPLGRRIAPNAALLSPRGQVLERGMPRFFRRIAEGVFDLDDLRARTHGLADWLERAIAHHQIDRARLVAVGFSNGANIAASLLLLRPEVLAGAVLLSPMVPFEPDAPPALAGKSVMVVYGRHDPIAPPASAIRLGEILASGGADVKMVETEEGHAISMRSLGGISAWLEHFAAK